MTLQPIPNKDSEETLPNLLQKKKEEDLYYDIKLNGHRRI